MPEKSRLTLIVTADQAALESTQSAFTRSGVYPQLRHDLTEQLEQCGFDVLFGVPGWTLDDTRVRPAG